MLGKLGGDLPLDAVVCYIYIDTHPHLSTHFHSGISTLTSSTDGKRENSKKSWTTVPLTPSVNPVTTTRHATVLQEKSPSMMADSRQM